MHTKLRPFLLLAILLLSVFPSAAQVRIDVWSNGGKHPVELKDNADCSACHEALSQGKYVHTAMSMGCTTCHTVSQKNGDTYVELMAPVTQICLTCHSLSSEKVLHGPYKQGDCVICHSPHSSNFPQHTRADHQNLCLGCHTHQRLKVNPSNHSALLPWGVTLSPEITKNLPFLALDKNLTKGHPIQGHPVSGPNKAAGKDAPPVTCLSCHNPHASDFPFIYAMPAKYDTYPCPNCLICMKCHRPTDLAE